MPVRRSVLVLFAALTMVVAGLVAPAADAGTGDGAGGRAACTIKIVHVTFSKSWWDVDTKQGNFSAWARLSCRHRHHSNSITLTYWYQRDPDAKPTPRRRDGNLCTDTKVCKADMRMTHVPAEGRYCVKAKGKAYTTPGTRKHVTALAIKCFTYR
jgi:hypothetical protein